MKTIHTYVCLVDNYRRPSRQRNTKGRYLVGAKTSEEAKKLLQDAIGFGSVQVYYRATDDNGAIINDKVDRKMPYKSVVRVQFEGEGKRNFIEPRLATDTY